MAETVTQRTQRGIKEQVVQTCWEYLNNNFHKFTETNKIKVALELCKKDLPQQIESTAEGTKIFVIRDGKVIASSEKKEDSPKDAGREISFNA